MSSLTNISFRRADSKDIHFLGLLHLKTFTNSMGASIGLNYTKAFFKWFIFNQNSINLVCCASGKIVGYVIGAPEGYSKTLTKSIRWNLMFGIFTHPKVVLHPNFFNSLKNRILNLFDFRPNQSTSDKSSFLNDIENSTFVLVGIGIDPEFREQQIGIRILKEYEKLVCQSNYSKIRLTVYKSNQAAIKLYEKAGWSLLRETGKNMTYLKTIKNNNGD